MPYPIYADLHTHTIGSLHGYSTIKENIEAAASKDLRYLAITDHLYYHEDRMQRKNEVARISIFNQYGPRHEKVNVISGVETNLNHNIEQADALLIQKTAPWRLVGAHSWFIDTCEAEVSNIIRFYNEALTDPNRIKPTAFAHIERTFFCFKRQNHDIHELEDILKQIVDLAVENDIFIEINEQSLHMSKEIIHLITEWVKFAKTKNAKFCLGTDAHYCDRVGDFTEVFRFMDDIDMRHEYVLNFDSQALKAFLENQ